MPRFTLTDESLDADRERVLMDGADLNRFIKNPVMLYRHYSEPIGRWEGLRFETLPDGSKRLTAEAVFDEGDELGAWVAAKVRGGFLKACSIGFRAIERSDEPSLMVAGQRYPTVTKWELLECSICPIGANENALAEVEHDAPMALAKALAAPKDGVVYGGLKSVEIESPSEEVHIMKDDKNPNPAAGAGASASTSPDAAASATAAALAEQIVSLGKAKGIINDTNEAEYKSLAAADPDALLRLLAKSDAQAQAAAAAQPRTLLTDAIKEAAAAGGSAAAATAAPKSWADYEKQDPAALKKMLAEDADAAEVLAKEYLQAALEGK